ncbi:MAG TPA: trypsin-like peptidase domain-containing protein, partial [Candidatus Methylacidiphilales bacterium]|nr:trypsin-like peptidase domain-containing protein [Candidatus Methylacidiphilales bacterium]
PLRAVANISSGTATPTYTDNEGVPTSSNIANWQTGWVQPATQPTGFTSTTGWNYVGLLGSEGGVYLGNGWVITCAHVGAGNFVLNGVTYPMVPNSTRSFYNGGTPYDFLLFRVSPAPALPALPLRSSDPVKNSSVVALIGYGDPTSVESWGCNTATAINESINLNGFVTNDFLTQDFTSDGGHITNNYQIEGSNVTGGGGDSGGGDFIYNSTTGFWELAGLNEANGTANGNATSFFVQLDTYAAQIEQIVAPPVGFDTPAMPPWALIVLGGILGLAAVPQLLRAFC